MSSKWYEAVTTACTSFGNYVEDILPTKLPTQLQKVFLPPGSGFLRRNFPNIDDEFS